MHKKKQETLMRREAGFWTSRKLFAVLKGLYINTHLSLALREGYLLHLSSQLLLSLRPANNSYMYQRLFSSGMDYTVYK